MKSLAATGRSSTELVELFADRERLTGKARERFRDLLQETLVPALARSGRHWRTWCALSVAFTPSAVFGFLFVQEDLPPAWFTTGCIAYSVLGVALALGFRRAREISRADVEVSWVAYCTVFRPALLELMPGLLDRNLSADTRERLTVAEKRATSLRQLWRERDEELWSASLTGISGGVVVMAALAVSVPVSPTILLIPPPVALVAIVIWLKWNRRSLRRPPVSG